MSDEPGFEFMTDSKSDDRSDQIEKERKPGTEKLEQKIKTGNSRDEKPCADKEVAITNEGRHGGASLVATSLVVKGSTSCATHAVIAVRLTVTTTHRSILSRARNRFIGNTHAFQSIAALHVCAQVAALPGATSCSIRAAAGRSLCATFPIMVKSDIGRTP